MITIALITYNEEKILPITIDATLKQGFPVVCADNESTDKTRDLLDQYGIKWLTFPHQKMITPNVCKGRCEVLKLVDTEFVFFLDADVKLPDGAVKGAYDYLIENPKRGLVCVMYVNGHTRVGASITRTALAKEYDWKRIDGCDCLNYGNFLQKKGLEMVNHPTLYAEHWKKGEKIYPFNKKEKL